MSLIIIVNNKKRNNINKRNNIINIEYYFKMVFNFSFSQKTFICHLQFLKRNDKKKGKKWKDFKIMIEMSIKKKIK